MNKVTEHENEDDDNCVPFKADIATNALDSTTTINSKGNLKERNDAALRDHVNSFYNAINSSKHAKVLTPDASFRLSDYSDTLYKSNKIHYKNSSSYHHRYHNFLHHHHQHNRNNSVGTITATESGVHNSEERTSTDKNCSSDSDDSTDSDFSNLSGLSDLSGQEWKPITKSIMWTQKQINSGARPRDILSRFFSNGATITPNLSDISLWRILTSMLSEPPRRQKLRNINTIDDVVRLLKESKNILILTGAGVSVSCGIPDFRSSDGIYSRLSKDFPDLPDPQAMFDISYFSKDPRPFYKFAHEIYPGQFAPSPCHRFIRLLEKKQKLLRNYTQNIDTLEQLAGIQNVIECHGSFATASCTKCKYKTTADNIKDDIFAQRIPLCPKCHPNYKKNGELANSKLFSITNLRSSTIQEKISVSSSSLPSSPLAHSLSDLVQSGIMKPDIVFFGEGLPDAFHSAMASDKDKCDLLIVIGSSLKVRPVALIPSSIPSNVPQILINREQLSHLEFDVELLGDSDIIINYLCQLLGDDWKEICWDSRMLVESRQLKSNLKSCIRTNISTIDIDSQSSKSATTINSSNGVFCDSGFESSSSFHALTSQSIECSDSTERKTLSEYPPIIKSPKIEENLFRDYKYKQTKNLNLSDELKVTNYDNDKKIKVLKNDTDSSSNEVTNTRIYDSSSCSTILLNASVLHTKEKETSTDDSNNADADNDANFDEDDNGIAVGYDEDIEETELGEDIDLDDYNEHYLRHRRNEKILRLSSNANYLSFNKTISVSERLKDNTFYYNPKTCSYVFPGAQVYWGSDSEYEEDDIDVKKTNVSKIVVGESQCETTKSNNIDQSDKSNDSTPSCKRRRIHSQS